LIYKCITLFGVRIEIGLSALEHLITKPEIRAVVS
jgi:hypothetical protein